MQTAHVFILSDGMGHRLGLRPLEPEHFALDDLDENTTLGEVFATLTPFAVTRHGERFVVCVGPQATKTHTMTVIEGTPYPVKNGAWISLPIPYRSAMQIEGIWQDGDGREEFRLTTPVLGPDTFGHPVFGPNWTHYGPRDD